MGAALATIFDGSFKTSFILKFYSQSICAFIIPIVSNNNKCALFMSLSEPSLMILCSPIYEISIHSLKTHELL